MRRGLSVLGVVLLAVLLCGTLTARAQDATPSMGGLPVTPDPSECPATTMTAQDLMGRMGITPVPSGMGSPVAEDEGAMPAATPASFTLPTGMPADEETVAAVTTLVRQVFACFNAGDFLGFLSMASDDYLQQVQAEEPMTAEDVTYLGGTPMATDPSAYGTVVDIRQVTLLPDGRVGMLIDSISPDEGPGVQTDWVELVQEDGVWKIDRVVEDLEGQYPPEGQAMATPTS